MGSRAEATNPNPGRPPRRALTAFLRWNRRLHYFLGLYLLFFVWLFAFTGLLLNHPGWTFAEFWNNRKQITYEHAIQPPAATTDGDLGLARDIAKQLGVSGEIEWTTTRSDDARLDFRITHPGRILEIKADWGRGRATVREIDVNLWGVIRMLHTFTGVRLDDPRSTRDWRLTSVWAFAMDAVAAGLIFMVLSSLVMWYELPARRWPGGIALALGSFGGILFCVGLRWLY